MMILLQFWTFYSFGLCISETAVVYGLWIYGGHGQCISIVNTGLTLLLYDICFNFYEDLVTRIASVFTIGQWQVGYW